MILAGAAGRASPQVAQTAPRYAAVQLDCARFEETSHSAITTQTARRASEGGAGRRAIWALRARDTTGGVAVEAWYDSLEVWRRTEGGTLRADTDGIIGGRYRGRLTAAGSFHTAVRPFIPDEVAEVADLTDALDDLLPPLPPVPLRPGGSWRRPGLAFTRLADTLVGGRRLLHFSLEITQQARETVPRGDTQPVALTQATEERGTLLWDPASGLNRRDREITIEASIPAGSRIRLPVRSRIVQHVTLTRLPTRPTGCS